jgi:hypothetical protein
LRLQGGVEPVDVEVLWIVVTILIEMVDRQAVGTIHFLALKLAAIKSSAIVSYWACVKAGT